MINDKNTPDAVAWILYINPDIAIALGQFEIIYILKYEKNKLKNINGPVFCNQSVLWKDKLIKVFDLDCFINIHNKDIKKILYEYIVIIPYIEDEKKDILFLGLKVINIPVKRQVKDTQQCDYPDNYDWDKLSSSCFYDEKYGIIPVLDLTKISASIGK